MKNIKDIFFDLDNTLWDFEKNSETTLLEIINEFNLINKGVNNAQDFIKRYKKHNERLWTLYRDNKITKEKLRGERFLLTLKEYGLNDPKLANDFGLAYIKKSPLKKILFPFTIQVLSYLKSKYNLHIITNGFEEVQHVKLQSSNLTHYFKNIITSEEVGVKKPNKKIFQYALKISNADPNQSIMIGDDLISDIKGAAKLKIKTIFFNPKKIQYTKTEDYEISCLSEIMDLL